MSAQPMNQPLLDLRDLLSGSTEIAASGHVEMDKLLAHPDFDTQSQPGSNVRVVQVVGGAHRHIVQCLGG